MPRRLAVLAAVAAVAATLSGRAHAAEPIVLARTDAPGLKAAATTPAATRRVLADTIRPALLPATRPVRQAASRFTRKGVELRSLALVYRSAPAASRELTRLAAALRRGRLRSLGAPVGEPGRRVRTKRGLVVVWRRGPAIGAIVLRSSLRPGNAAALGVGYARLHDARLAETVTASAWERALRERDRRGRLTRAASLQLFALAYAPLPGTRAPAGPRGDPEGTLAARAVLRTWRTLSSPQRRAALRALGLSRVAIRRGGRAVDSDGAWAGVTYGDPQLVQDAALQKIADGWLAAYAAKLPGRPAKVKTLVVGMSPGARNGFADSLPVEADGTLSDAATFCRIRVGPAAVAQGDARVRFALAHEVFHCLQYDIMGPTAGASAPDWLAEGSADWGALSVDSVWTAGGAGFEGYFKSCRQPPLFERSYSAVGFFGHAEDATGALWPRLTGILVSDNLSSYAAAGGANATMLDSWGSSVAVKSAYGLNWTAQSPVVPPGGISCAPTPLAAPGAVSAAPFTVNLYELSGGPDADNPILHVQIKGHARISDGSLDTAALSDAYFCVVGKCECPEGTEGSPPPAPKLMLPASLGVTGGRVGSGGPLTLDSLEQYCEKKDKKPPPPPPGPPIGGGGGGGDGGGGPGGCTGGCGGSNGDPHLTTLDGVFYDFHGAGEYVLVRSRRDRFEVQAREEPYPGSTTLAVNTAIALRVERARVVVETGTPLVVRVNGRGFLVRRSFQQLPGGGRIRDVSGQVEIAWADGSLARVWSVSSWGVAVLVKPALARRGTLTGLLGNFDGDQQNDFATRSGRRLDPGRLLGSHRLLYRTFGDTWRVTQRGSLLDYARGQSTRTFTNRRFPAKIGTAASLSRRARLRAERICRRLRITDPRILEGCIIDVAATGDGRFATSGATLQRTGLKFGSPPRAGVADTRWASLGAGGRSNTLSPSLAYDAGKVVVAYDVDNRSAEAVVFTPSATSDAQGITRTRISAGWGFLNHPVVLPKAGGGLQVLLAGSRGSDSGTWFASRNADGTFGALTLATTATSDSTGARGAVLAPDGSPLWVQATAGGLKVFRGATNATGADLATTLRLVDVIRPQIGRDGMGRYWISWYALGSKGGPASGVYLLRLDPASLAPVGPARRAPSSGLIWNDYTTLVCGGTCRVVYEQESGRTRRIVTWAAGEARASVVVSMVNVSPWLAAAYGADGRLWVAWYDANITRYRVIRGNAAGAGGTPVTVGAPFTSGSGFLISGVVTPAGFVLVTNWTVGATFVRFVNVVPS